VKCFALFCVGLCFLLLYAPRRPIRCFKYLRYVIQVAVAGPVELVRRVSLVHLDKRGVKEASDSLDLPELMGRLDRRVLQGRLDLRADREMLAFGATLVSLAQLVSCVQLLF